MSNERQKHRSHLPMPNTVRPRFIAYDAKDPDYKTDPIEQLRPPAGAPNVLIVLIDDCGFGAPSAFGGPCQTPAAEKLAAGGLRFNRFHTTAICSATRQALLTGRNHHSAGMAGITEIATGAPGYSSVLPNSMSPLAKTLKLNGYNTAQFGKCHEVPVWESSPVGPFNQWPTGGGGFEYFYGFVGGEAHQWYPSLYEGTTPIEAPKLPEDGYHLMEDLADKAIAWISQQKSLAPDKPFFVYFAPGATHAPHHVPKEWADKYKGKFDAGWDKLRDETFARQKKLGVIPAECELTPRPKDVPAWDDMPQAFKPVLRRQMEVYAGFLEYTDHHVGRLFETLEKLGLTDDTLIYYIIGDNGASAEGSFNGCFNEMSYFNGLQALETAEYLTERLDKLGGPESYNHYAVGWAHALNALSVDQAGRLALGRHTERDHRPLAKRDRGEGRAADTVRARHRRGADDPRGGGHPRAGLGGRHPAGSDRGHQHALRVRRRERPGTPRDTVLRGPGQPRHLSQRLDGRHEALHAVAAGRKARARRRRVGALSHEQGLGPGQGPVERDAGQAA
jgi:arylsulfatase